MTVLAPPADPPADPAPGGLPAIRRCVAEIAASLSEVADAQPAYLSTTDKAAALAELVAVEAQVHELRLRVMAIASDVVAESGAHDIAAWLGTHTRLRAGDARHEQRLALALDRRYPAVAAGMRTGRINPAQAHVITHTLDTLTDHAEVDEHTLARAEQHLVTQAAHFAPRPLARLARHVLDVIAPDIAEEADARRLAALEAAARTRTRLTLRRVGDGTTRITGLLPDPAATRLATYLEALTNPRLPDRVSTSSITETTGTTGAVPGADITTRLPYPRRLGEAFVQFLETIDPARLPIHGGDATTVVITLPLDDLRSRLATAELVGGATIPQTADDPDSWTTSDQLTAAQARRLACNAHLIPAVLGTDSEILDLGRTTRLFTRAQRRALLLRDRTCRAEGCDRPGAWSEAHHLQPWSQAGPTDLSNAVLLCSADHHRAHDPDYHTQRLPNGDIRFHRRT